MNNNPNPNPNPNHEENVHLEFLYHRDHREHRDFFLKIRYVFDRNMFYLTHTSCIADKAFDFLKHRGTEITETNHRLVNNSLCVFFEKITYILSGVLRYVSVSSVPLCFKKSYRFSLWTGAAAKVRRDTSCIADKVADFLKHRGTEITETNHRLVNKSLCVFFEKFTCILFGVLRYVLRYVFDRNMVYQTHTFGSEKNLCVLCDLCGKKILNRSLFYTCIADKVFDFLKHRGTEITETKHRLVSNSFSVFFEKITYILSGVLRYVSQSSVPLCFKKSHRFSEVLRHASFSLCSSLCFKKSYRFYSWTGIAMLMFIATSCNMAPKYRRPAVETPEDYRVHLTEFNGDNSGAFLKWWQQFEDVALNNLIVDALANNYDLKIAVARVEEYNGILGVISSDLFPQIGGNLHKYRDQISLVTKPPGLDAFRRFNTFTATVNAAYELDIWGRIRSSSDAAYNDYLAQIGVRRTVVLTLVTQVAASYIQLRKLDKQLEISINTLKSRIEAERIAKARFEEGLTSELEYKQAESSTESAIIAIKVLEISIPQQENLISVLIGRASGPIPRDKTLNTLSMPPSVPVGIPSDILNQRPDIMRAEDELVAANFRIGVARAAFFPNISLTGFYGSQSSELHKLFTSKSIVWGTSIDLFQPLFTGGRLISQLEIAKAIKSEACYNYHQIVLNALREVNDALIAHKINLELVVEQQKQVKIYQRYRYLSELQYNNGQSDYLNVLDAERRLFEAQLLLADTEGDSFTSLINLYRALGGSWIIDAENLSLAVTDGCS